MLSRLTIVLLFFCFFSVACLAQLRLPRIDIEAKVHQTLIPAGSDKGSSSLKAISTANLLLGAHVQINQNIAIGWIYSSSFKGSGYNTVDFKGNIFGNGDSKASTLISGPDLRISTGRASKWRPYLSINYSNVQIVEDKDSFRFSTKLTAIGGSFGIMRRYGNHLYWNVLEVGVKKMSQKLFWGDQDSGMLIDLKMGFTYNIGKQK